MPLTLLSLLTKKVFSVTSPDNQQNEVSGRLRELLKKKLIAFSSVRALRCLPLPGRLLTVPVSRNLLNSLLLTPGFVQLLSGNSSVDLFAVYPFKYKVSIGNISKLRVKDEGYAQK